MELIDLKLMIIVLAIRVQNNSAAAQNTLSEEISILEWATDNVIRKSNIQKLPPTYKIKIMNVPQGRIGKGYGKPERLSSKAGYGRSKADRKKKLRLEDKEIVRKITPVEVILDVEVRNSKERDAIEKILLNGVSAI